MPPVRSVAALDRNKWHNKCSVLESSQNHPPFPVHQKLSSTKPGPGAKHWGPLVNDRTSLFFLPHCTACWIFVPQPAIESRSSAPRAQSPNHWSTREFPEPHCCFFSFIFNWRIIAFQCCADFRHTTTWIIPRHTYVPSLLNLPLSLYPIPPL